jgi:ABC-2 type transport system ATP-binding protein
VPTEELRVIEGPDAGGVVELSEPIVVGRDPACTLALTDDQVSRRHAEIAINGQATVEDLGSTNGTYVDGKLVVGKEILRPRSRIRVGDTEIEYSAALAPTVVRDAAASRAAAPAPTEGWNGIEIQGLVREFTGGFRAIDELDLRVNPGEIYGFLGPNGAGKSTTVHVLTTLLAPSLGTAQVAGFDVARNPAEVRAMIGVALQEASLDPLLSAYEHMNLQCAMQGLPRSEWKARGRELIERVSLTEAADRPAGGYSGGMKRRLDLALALVHRPRILFLDEPTTGLDPKSRGDLWEEVGRLAKEDGVTVFLTTQYLEEADVLADRVGIINHGQLVIEGTPAELKATIGLPTAEIAPQDPAQEAALSAVLERFGEPVPSTHGVAVQLRAGAEALPDLVRAVDQAGITVADVELHKPSLDDVFLKETGRSLEQQAEVESGVMEIPPARAAAPASGAATE